MTDSAIASTPNLIDSPRPSGDSARAGQSANVLDAEIPRALRGLPPILPAPELATGAVLLCPHCGQVVHVQLLACDLRVDISQGATAVPAETRATTP